MHEFFYFKPAKIKQQFTSTPTGQISFDKAANRDPKFWKKDDTATTKQKKTIVLSDFRFEQLNPTEASNLKVAIDRLTNEGFTVYLWQQGGAVKLTQNTSGLFLSQSERKKCIPVSDKQIYEAMITKNCSQEAVAIMDIDMLQGFPDLDYSSYKRGEIKIDEILQSSFNWHEIISNLSYPLQIVAPDEPNEKQTHKIKRLTDLKQIVEYSDPQIQSTKAPSALAEPRAREKPEVHKGDKQLKMIDAVTELQKNKDLKRIQIEGNKYQTKELKLAQINLLVNQQMGTENEDYINNPDIPKEIIQVLIRSIEEKEKPVQFNPAALSELKHESLKSLSFSDFSNEELRLINCLPNLEDINWTYTGNPLDTIIPEGIYANKLARFEFNSVNDLSFNLDDLIKFSPNLVTFELNMVAGNATIIQSKTPLNIREIVVNRVDVVNLNNLLKSAPLCEQLEIGLYDSKVCINTETLEHLKAVRRLKTTLSNMDSKIKLGSLMASMPELTSLEIYGNDQANFSQGVLPKLPEHFKLQNLTLQSVKLVAENTHLDLIKRSPDLRQIHFPNVQNINWLLENLKKDGCVLHKLKKINLSKSNLDKAGFELLRAIAPNLEEVNLSYCENAKDIVDDSIYISRDKPSPTSGTQAEQTTGTQTQQGSPQKRFMKGEGKHQVTNTVDSRTTLDEYNYQVTKIFHDVHQKNDPQVREYRISTFNQLSFGHDPANPFSLSNQGNEEFIPYDISNIIYGNIQQTVEKAKAQGKQAFKGQCSLKLSEQFVPLPSLFINETLSALDISGLKKTDIEIKYSQRDNLYYIRKKSKGAISASVEFLVEEKYFPTLESSSDINQIKELVQLFNDRFGAGTLNVPDKATGEQIIEAMFEQKLGRCAHRAVMFKHQMQKRFGDKYPVRIVMNDTHGFVEVKFGNQWQAFDLGGYPANVETLEQKATQELSPKGTSLEKNPYKTWEGKESEQSPYLFTQHALNQITVDSKTGESLGQNVLIRCQDDESANILALTLQHTAKHTMRPVFVINDSEQINCAQKWLKRGKDNVGSQMDGPGGALYDFLTQDFTGQEPVLIVNWNNFSADELVRFNSLIDQNRLADGSPLPKNMVVVGLYNTQKPNAYTGSDFYSRNPIKLDAKISLDEIHKFNQEKFGVTLSEEKPTKEIEVIELYDSLSWKEILLGQWTMQGEKLVFSEGEFAKALKAGKGVHLKNAPWHIPEFQQFFIEAKINGKILTVGETLNIPAEFFSKLTQSTGYEWKNLATNVKFVDKYQAPEMSHVINLSTIKQYFDHYEVENKTFAFHHGLFSKHQNQTLPLLITNEISAASWAKLLNEAKKYHVKLEIAVPESIAIPESLEKELVIKRVKDKIDAKKNVSVIESKDCSFSVANLKTEDPKALVIDVSELDETDILVKTDANYSQDKLILTQKICEVQKRLKKEGETIILTGHFGDSLIDALMPLCLNNEFKGKLILVSDTTFPSLFKTEQHRFELAQKLDTVLASSLCENLTASQLSAIKGHIWPSNVSYTQIQSAIFHYLHTSPPSFDITEGIVSITSKPTLPIQQEIDLSDEHVQTVSKQFVQDRLKTMGNVLSYAPFVCIGGKTGVGKSTFMDKYVTPENGYKLYHELKSLKAWAEDKMPGKKKILFIDEANTADTQYTQFEGLFQDPPFIQIDGELIELTPDHGVAFAINPVSYGGERQVPTLLAQHGNACIFDVMPSEYIYQEILKPIFKDAGLNEREIKSYSQVILGAYRKICAISQDEIWISPRELKMMAMMIVSSSDKSIQNIDDIVYQVAEQCLPENIKAQFPKPQPIAVKLPPPSGQNPFILTQSREPVYASLQRLLAVRKTIQANPTKSGLQSPGLGGMILEGEPGTGKSHFYMDVLKQENETFRFIPASMKFEEKRKILLEAFDKGEIVVTDEINSGPAMEQVLNALLMGQHPDTKHPPLKKGFMLLGTQNPASMAGRQVTGAALKRRLLFQNFCAYTEIEMRQILTQTFSNLSKDKIEKHLKLFVQASTHAKAAHIDPMPVFRDLYKNMERISKKDKYKPHLVAIAPQVTISPPSPVESHPELSIVPEKPAVVTEKPKPGVEMEELAAKISAVTKASKPLEKRPTAIVHHQPSRETQPSPKSKRKKSLSHHREAKPHDNISKEIRSFLEAINKNDAATIERLIKKEDVLKPDYLKVHGITTSVVNNVLFAAMRQQNEYVLREAKNEGWLFRGYDEIYDEKGNTLLHCAVLEGKHKIIATLIELGVSPNANQKIPYGKTALELAEKLTRDAFNELIDRSEELKEELEKITDPQKKVEMRKRSLSIFEELEAKHKEREEMVNTLKMIMRKRPGAQGG